MNETEDVENSKIVSKGNPNVYYQTKPLSETALYREAVFYQTRQSKEEEATHSTQQPFRNSSFYRVTYLDHHGIHPLTEGTVEVLPSCLVIRREVEPRIVGRRNVQVKGQRLGVLDLLHRIVGLQDREAGIVVVAQGNGGEVESRRADVVHDDGNRGHKIHVDLREDVVGREGHRQDHDQRPQKLSLPAGPGVADRGQPLHRHVLRERLATKRCRIPHDVRPGNFNLLVRGSRKSSWHGNTWCLCVGSGILAACPHLTGCLVLPHGLVPLSRCAF